MNTWGHTVPAQNGEFGRSKPTPNSRFPWEAQSIRIEIVYSINELQQNKIGTISPELSENY